MHCGIDCLRISTACYTSYMYRLDLPWYHTNFEIICSSSMQNAISISNKEGTESVHSLGY